MVVYKKFIPNFDESFDFEVQRLLKKNIECGFLFFTESAKSEYDKIHVTPRFKMLGAVFPKLIFDSKVIETGAILICFEYTLIAQGIDTNNFSKMSEGEIKKSFEDFSETTSLLVFADSRFKSIDKSLSVMYDYLGPDVQIFGSYIDNLMASKSIFLLNNQWIEADMLLISLMAAKSRHESFGWIKDCGPFLITDKSSFDVKTIDYEPAVNFYTETLKKSVYNNNSVDSENLFKFHPLGSEHINGSISICQIERIQDNYLLTSVDLNQNSFVYFLKFDHKNLISITDKLMQRLLKDRRTQQAYDTLVFCSLVRHEISNLMDVHELSLLSVLGSNYGGMCAGIFKNKLNGSFEMQPLLLQCNSLERKSI